MLFSTALVLALASPTRAEDEPPEEPLPALDLNAAGVEALDELPGVGPARAQAIVRFRERTGGFRCVEELLAVPRFPEKVYERIRERVVAGGPFARPEACRPPVKSPTAPSKTTSTPIR